MNRRALLRGIAGTLLALWLPKWRREIDPSRAKVLRISALDYPDVRCRVIEIDHENGTITCDTPTAFTGYPA